MCISRAKRPDDYHKRSWWVVVLCLCFVPWVDSVVSLLFVHRTDQRRERKLHQHLPIIIGSVKMLKKKKKEKKRGVASMTNAQPKRRHFKNTVHSMSLQQRYNMWSVIISGYVCQRIICYITSITTPTGRCNIAFPCSHSWARGNKKRESLPAKENNSQQNLHKEAQRAA